jgi:hypothetical protein
VSSDAAGTAPNNRLWPGRPPIVSFILWAIGAVALAVTIFLISQLPVGGLRGPQGIQGAPGPPGLQGAQGERGPAGPPAPAEDARIIGLQNQITSLTQRIKDATRFGVLQVCMSQLVPLAQKLENDHFEVLREAAIPGASSGGNVQWFTDLQDVMSMEKECYPEDTTNLYADPSGDQMYTPTLDEPQFPNDDVKMKYRHTWYQWNRAKQSVQILQGSISQALQELAESDAQWSRN